MINEMPRQLRHQWTHLLVLTGAHFVLDSFPGLMHTVLPAFQASFQLSMAAGGVLLTMFLVSANGIQVLIGHTRPENDKPFYLFAGLLLTCFILLFWLVPPGGIALLWLSLISIAAGAGVGMTHPESLKAVHRLEGISSATSSTIFMGGGVFGFAVGGWSGTHLYGRWGFAGLIPFCAASLLIFLVLAALRIRLAVENDDAIPKKVPQHCQPVSFWMIFAIAALTTSSVQVLMWIVPQHVNQIGADLALGGKTVSLFTLAGGIGGIMMARFTADDGEMKTIVRMLAAGIPFVVAYVLLLGFEWSWMLLCVGGFFCFGAYPLMVSAARHSKGQNLGSRMGWVVGGVWLIACLLPMLLGPVAEHAGTLGILFCVPIGFVLSLALAIKSKPKN